MSLLSLFVKLKFTYVSFFLVFVVFWLLEHFSWLNFALDESFMPSYCHNISFCLYFNKHDHPSPKTQQNYNESNCQWMNNTVKFITITHSDLTASSFNIKLAQTLIFSHHFSLFHCQTFICTCRKFCSMFVLLQLKIYIHCHYLELYNYLSKKNDSRAFNFIIIMVLLFLFFYNIQEYCIREKLLIFSIIT